MLRDDVLAAVEAGLFHVYAISSVDEAIALLTGTLAGTRDTDGTFPDGCVNRTRRAASADARARTPQVRARIERRGPPPQECAARQEQTSWQTPMSGAPESLGANRQSRWTTGSASDPSLELSAPSFTRRDNATARPVHRGPQSARARHRCLGTRNRLLGARPCSRTCCARKATAGSRQRSTPPFRSARSDAASAPRFSSRARRSGRRARA